MGETSRMTVLEFQSNTGSTLSIDVNRDGLNDLELAQEQVKVLGPVFASRTVLKCLRGNMQIESFRVNDSTFHAYSIFIRNGVKDKYYETKISCRRKSPKDSLVKVSGPESKVFYRSEGETINTDDQFQSSNFTLKEEGTTYTSNNGISNDTTIYSVTRYYPDCYSMPSGSPVFIGFKLMAEEKTLLGWIKIEGSQVQTAVQE